MRAKTIYRRLFKKLQKRLPQTYPKAKLVVHNSQKSLDLDFWETDSETDFQTYAWCCAEDMTIHISEESLKDEDINNVMFILLHEIGHLYIFKKYGKNDERWADEKISEKYAEEFASRWSKKLIKERFPDEE